ncbi:PglD-related sugar-binding protein [Sphingomonas sp. Ag1]|uniref:PglD-related sugar-binding protein n=1 Tax=Sphingomonas sp. Ag1 TaxID=1642949 RepID=UPI000AD3D344|nr:hexapeptide transferase [Sphingomonas sp. Ag1]
MKEHGRLILAGGGGFGRELASWADHCTAAGSLPPLFGFVDDRPETMAEHDTPWLGRFDDFRVLPDDRFLVAVGNPATKVRMVQSLRERGGHFVSLIHPSVVLGRNHRHGEGVIMAPFSMNTSDTALGDFVTILSFSGLGHDASAGDFTTISSHVDVMGGATLGKRVMVGSGARIMPNVHVGDDARIGAGALVLRRVAAGATMFTPAAKRLRLGEPRSEAR